MKFGDKEHMRALGRLQRAWPTSRKSRVMAVAARFAKAVGGGRPEHIGEHRWSDPNDSATVTTYSPDEGVKVVCVISEFRDKTWALDFYSDEGLSGIARFESIGHQTYHGASVKKMAQDLRWVWKTVERYARSWRTDSDDDEPRDW